MTGWTLLLEALHSAVIDELTERHPEPKPTLGMPKRQAALLVPWDHKNNLAGVLISEVILDDPTQSSSGFILLAVEDGFSQRLSLTAEEFWNQVLNRAGTEFHRKGIRPRLGNRVRISEKGEIPPGYSSPQRVIWIPFSLPNGSCYLGVAI